MEPELPLEPAPEEADPLLEEAILPRLDEPDEPLPPELLPEEDKKLLNPLLTEPDDPLLIPDLELAALPELRPISGHIISLFLLE